MTAKRFKFNGRTNCIEYDGKSILLDSYGEDIEELLNELHDEKQSVIDWIDRKIEEIKPYNSELCRATLLELKEYLE